MLRSRLATTLRTLLCTALIVLGTSARADEPCQSPYLPKVTGQEDFVYVFMLGVEGLGDGRGCRTAAGLRLR